MSMYLRFVFLLLLLTGVFVNLAAAQQTAGADLAQIISVKDELFWTGYNTCNYAQMGEFVWEDVEFYHDKGGITLGKTALLDSIKNNLCSNPKFHTRREAVAGTVKVYLLKKADVAYGAIISGDHYFFNSYDGKPERREGLAKFMNLWLFKDNAWKMARVLSYDHKSAPYENTRRAVPLAKNTLNRFTGEFRGPQSGISKITPGDNTLILMGGKNKYILYPETNNRFFVKDRDLTFEFISEKGKVIKMVIRENGEVTEEAPIVAPAPKR